MSEADYVSLLIVHPHEYDNLLTGFLYLEYVRSKQHAYSNISGFEIPLWLCLTVIKIQAAHAE